MWGTGNGRGHWRKLLGLTVPKVCLGEHKRKRRGRTGGRQEKGNVSINLINFLSAGSHDIIFINTSRSL